MTDTLAIQLFKSGDPSGFTHLFNVYNSHLVNYLHRNIVHHSDVEDIAQDTWLRVHKNIDKYDRGTFIKWLCTIAMHIYIDELRIRKRFYCVGDAGAVEHVAAVMAETEDEDMVRLRQKIQRLKGAKRDIIVLKTYGDMTHRQIVKVMKYNSTSTSIATYRRAFLELKKMMK